MKNLSLVKSSLVVILLFFSGVISAQVAKGTFRLGPIIDFSSANTEIDAFNVDFKTTQMNIGTTMGYYVIDNLEIGLGFIVLNSKTETGFDEETSTGIYVGPRIEYKIGLSPQFYIPISGGLGYNAVNNEDDGGNEANFSGISYSVSAGIEFIVNHKLGAVLIIGPEFGTLKEDELDLEYDITTITSTIGVNFYF